jgi:uncharacterized protein
MSVSQITLLLHSAMAGDLPSVERALRAGADVDAAEQQHGNTALMLAAYTNRSDIVAVLIRAGATIDARDKELNTALMKAAWAGAIDPARQLIDAGADVNAVEMNAMTALMIASFHGRLEVVRLLVESGADTDRVDMDGFTALRNAEEQAHGAIAQYLAPLTPVKRSSEPAHTSISFDLEQVEPFLARLSRRVDSGFSASDASALAAEIAKMPVDGEREWQLAVTFRGEPESLIIRAFMDDVAAPDIAVTGTRALVAVVEEEFGQFMN